MAKGFLYGSGASGGASLNFAIIGGTVAPEAPNENDIWINTDAEITSWAFSVDEPAGPEEGMVWIATDISSPVAFNALKKNNIYVYPISAKQRISGEWVDKSAKSYQGGKWVDWVTFLYNSGDECESLTSGWGSTKIANTSGSISYYLDVTVTRNEKSITANLGASGNTPHSNVFKTVEAIDLTEVKTITANIEGNTEHMYNYLNFITYPVSATSLGNAGENTSACLRLGNTGDYSIPPGDYSLDVSALSGRHYVGFYFYNTGGSTNLELTVNKVWMA